MALIDTLLAKLQGKDTAPAVTPTGSTVPSPYLRLLSQLGVEGKQEDPRKERNRAIAMALLTGGKALASTPGNFLSGVSQALPSGIGGYIKSRDDQEQDREKYNETLFDDALGIKKADDLAEYRTDSIEQRIAAAEARSGYQNDLLNLRRDIEGMRNEDRDRGLDIRDEQGGKRLDQAEERLRQAEERLNEVIRHNKTGEGISQQNADTGAGRLDESVRHNQTTEDQGQQRLDESKRHNVVGEGLSQQRNDVSRDRLDIYAQQGQRDAAEMRLKAQKQGVEIPRIIEETVAKKRSNMKLDDPLFNVRDPEGYAQAERDFEAWESNFRAGKGQAQVPAEGAAAPAAQPSAPASGAHAILEQVPVEMRGNVARVVERGGKVYLVMKDGSVIEPSE